MVTSLSTFFWRCTRIALVALTLLCLLLVAPTLHLLPHALHPPSTPLRGVVLTAASNIRDFGGLQRFISSLRQHSPTCAIVVFTDAASLHGDVATLFKTFDVMVEVFDRARDLPSFAFWPDLQWADIFRWILFARWMKGVSSRAGAPYDAVMFSDSRDLVFQSDIFASLAAFEGGGRGFYPVLESSHDSVAGSTTNSKWVEQCYGWDGIMKIGTSVVACSGTTLASWSDARAYAELMVSTMTEKATRDCIWADQGIHNYLLHTGILAKHVSAVYLLTHEEGFVVSLGTAHSFEVNQVGQVLNTAGGVASAVHQYDRWPTLLAHVKALHPWYGGSGRWTHRPPPATL